MQNRTGRPPLLPLLEAAREFLGQFSETRHHLIQARNEIFLALRSAVDTLIEKGHPNGKSQGGEPGNIRKLDID